MLVATAAADTGTLRLYQRCGFRMLGVERDAITAATGYPEPLAIDRNARRDRAGCPTSWTPLRPARDRAARLLHPDGAGNAAPATDQRTGRMWRVELWGPRLYGRPCRECGYDWSAAVGVVARTPQHYERLLDGRDASARHPDLSWTAGGYVCHVTDNLRIWAERLAAAALAGQVDAPAYDETALAAARNYNAVPVRGALWSLANAARDWVEAISLARDAKVVLAHARRGAQSVEEVVSGNAHDAYHHGWDIRRSLDASPT